MKHKTKILTTKPAVIECARHFFRSLWLWSSIKVKFFLAIFNQPWKMNSMFDHFLPVPLCTCHKIPIVLLFCQSNCCFQISVEKNWILNLNQSKQTIIKWIYLFCAKTHRSLEYFYLRLFKWLTLQLPVTRFPRTRRRGKNKTLEYFSCLCQLFQQHRWKPVSVVLKNSSCRSALL